MARQADRDDDDNRLTLRVSRKMVAAFVALVAHVVVIVVVQQLPAPKPKPKRIEMTVQHKPPPPPPAMTPEPAKTAPPSTTKPSKEKPTSAPPQTSTVAPELPPSESPPDNRAQLPVAEVSPTPAPPPTGSWKDKLAESLKPTPSTRPPTGALAPSFRALDEVTLDDAKLFDAQTEKRIAANFGQFFQRGVDALRPQWDIDKPLRDPNVIKRCGTLNRETLAVAILDKDGTVIDVELRLPSGCPEFDNEALKSFRKVGQFANPPAGLFVAPNGKRTETARFPVRFVVAFDGSFSLDWR